MSGIIGLIEFRTGDDVVRYTTRANDFLYGGFLWYPAPVKHADIVQTSEIDKNGIRMEFPLLNTFAQQFLGYGPDETTTVTLRRNKASDPDTFRVLWKGRVADCEANNDSIFLICESLDTTMKNAGLGPRMQKFCRHVVYHLGCNLDKAAFEVASTVTAIDSRFFTLICPGAAAHPNGYFNGGMLALPNSRLRYITNHVGNQITLWRPVPEIAAALALGAVSTTLYPGCDGSLNTCNDKFDNLDNNGGFYWIPAINPTDGTTIY